MKYVGVIAGNLREFHYFIREKADAAGGMTSHYNEVRTVGDLNYLYVSSPRVLRGRYFEDFIFYGTYYNRRDIEEIQDTLRYLRR